MKTYEENMKGLPEGMEGGGKSYADIPEMAPSTEREGGSPASPIASIEGARSRAYIGGVQKPL